MRQRGVTLIELLIGLAIMAMLLLAAMPFTQSWIDSNRQVQARSQLWEGMSQARALALRNPDAQRAGQPAATLRLQDDELQVITPETDDPVWAASVRADATFKFTDATGFADADVMAESDNPAFDCVSFDARGQRLPGAGDCSDTSLLNRRIAIGLSDQDPLYVDML